MVSGETVPTSAKATCMSSWLYSVGNSRPWFLGLKHRVHLGGKWATSLILVRTLHFLRFRSGTLRFRSGARCSTFVF